MLHYLEGCEIFKVFFLCFVQVCINNIDWEYNGLDSTHANG
jgi:hypothetical protein